MTREPRRPGQHGTWKLQPFPNNALIRRQAKELCAMEMMPFAEFIKSPLSWAAPIKCKTDERNKT